MTIDAPASCAPPSRHNHEAVTSDSLRTDVARLMETHWTPFGYAVPNAHRYPFQWLWDSCFHSLIWAELGDERALVELTSVFRHQTSGGFVPHMTYDADPAYHEDLWGRTSTSSVTQPPMFGFAVTELDRRGIAVPAEVLERSARALRFLLHRRRRLRGLVPLCHPWESGADDSPRWDHWCAPTWNHRTWQRRKRELVSSVQHDGEGAAVENPAFRVAGAGFNALVAFNAQEIARITEDPLLAEDAEELAWHLNERWDDDLETWTDVAEGDPPSTRVRTLDSLLPLLVCDRPWPRAVLSSTAFGTRRGPAGVHQNEPTYDPCRYWRGSTWPNVLYLLAVAAARRDEHLARDRLKLALRTGASRSSFAEHWHAETGAGLGGVPQSWTGLAIVDV